MVFNDDIYISMSKNDYDDKVIEKRNKRIDSVIS